MSEPSAGQSISAAPDHSGFTATRYTRDDARPEEYEQIEVELRCQAGLGPHKPPHDWWAATWRNLTLNRDGEWEYEPLPSSRSDEYLARCRFTLEQALELARKVQMSYGTGGGDE